MEQTKNIERFRLEMIVKAVEDLTTDFDITDALSDYLDFLRDFSGCIENIQNDCNGCLVIESYRKSLEFIKDGIGISTRTRGK